MNKTIISIAASLAVLGVVFAQVPGGFAGQGPQEAPRPGQTPFPLGQGGGMRAGGGGASVAASGDYVYVVSGNTLYQFSVNGLKLVTRATVPTSERQGRGEGGGDRGNRNNPPAN